MELFIKKQLGLSKTKKERIWIKRKSSMVRLRSPHVDKRGVDQYRKMWKERIMFTR